MFERTAHLDCGGFHTTRARMRGGTPLGALDIYIAPPPLEAWGAVLSRSRLPSYLSRPLLSSLFSPRTVGSLSTCPGRWVVFKNTGCSFGNMGQTAHETSNASLSSCADSHRPRRSLFE